LDPIIRFGDEWKGIIIFWGARNLIFNALYYGLGVMNWCHNCQ
jgi:hypothetical protein